MFQQLSLKTVLKKKLLHFYSNLRPKGHDTLYANGQGDSYVMIVLEFCFITIYSDYCVLNENVLKNVFLVNKLCAQCYLSNKCVFDSFKYE